jgi:hypothetical protein
MKTKKIIFLLTIIIVFSNNSYSQLKVLSNQKVQIGSTSNRYVGLAKSSDFGLVNKESTWLRIGSNGGVAFWGTSGVESNNSPIMVVNAYGLGIGASAQAWSGTPLYVNGNGSFTGSVYQGSDSRFKKNIEPLTNSLEKILKISGKKYNYNLEVLSDANLGNDKSIGFIAQELQVIVPEAVRKNENGFYAVNYSAIIPILVEAIKEENKKVIDLEEKLVLFKQEVEKMGMNISECCDKKGDINSIRNEIVSESNLFQNVPNPFTEKTTIAYSIQENGKNAQILILNMQGETIKSYKNLAVENGKGSIIINGGDLKSGMYLYTLIVNGKEVDTKRMILTN